MRSGKWTGVDEWEGLSVVVGVFSLTAFSVGRGSAALVRTPGHYYKWRIDKQTTDHRHCKQVAVLLQLVCVGLFVVLVVVVVVFALVVFTHS